jgi:hypothetical protein
MGDMRGDDMATEAAAAVAAAAGAAPAASGLQFVTALLKQLPRDQLQHVLREVRADADDAAAAGAVAAGSGMLAGAGIPYDLAEQLAASGVDLSSLPSQPSRQPARQQQQQQRGRGVAAAASSAAGPVTRPAGSTNTGN